MGGLRSLFGGKQPTTTPDYTGLQVQTAVNTLPVPIVWGMARIAPNVIWYANFQTHSSQGGKSGGKGGGVFSSNSTVSYTYTADIMLALCEGPVTGINTVWKNQSIYTLAELNLGLFPGTTPQAPWNYLVNPLDGQSIGSDLLIDIAEAGGFAGALGGILSGAGYGTQALGYNGTGYLAAASYQLSDAATIDNHNFEIQGFRYGSGYGQTPYTTYVNEIYNNITIDGGSSTVNSVLPFNGINPPTGFFDADPAGIIWDFLTNTQFGIAAPLGFPTASIDQTTLFTQGAGNDASLQTYCRAVGIALSPALTDQEQASTILDRWLQLCNCAAVWTNGQLKFVPYGDYPVSGNGIAFAPDVTPIYDLADDDYVLTSKDDDPLQVSRSDPYEAYNVWRLEVADRSNQYNLTTVESRDQNAIELFGIRLAPTVTAHEICDTGVGLISGQLMLQRAVYIRNTFKFTLSWEYCLLDPMDLVTVTDSILGLSRFPVRVTQIEEDENGLLTVTAEEFPQGAQTATLYATASSAGSTINRNASPGAANAPIIFEPTDALAGGLQIWIALCGQNSLWGGANVYASFEENGNYVSIGTVSQGAIMGVLSAELLAVTPNPSGGATVDQVNTLIVDLTESRGTLNSSSLQAALAGSTPCYVGGEVLSFATATLTAASKYNLTTLVRGLDDSGIATHAVGTSFALLNGAQLEYPFDASYIGQTVYFKFASFNVFGGGVQSLEDCPPYPYTITGAALASPLPNVANLRSTYNNQTGFQQLVWDSITDFRAFSYEVRSGASADAAMTLSTTASSPFIVPGDGTYWVSARYQLASGAVVYSEAWQSVTISGAVITQNVIKTVDLKALGWPGTFYGGAGVDSTLNAIRTGGGNILTDADFLDTADVLEYGGGQSGSYFPDDNAFLDIGYVANASVVIQYQPTGVPVGQNALTIGDFLNTPDVLGSASTQFIDIYPEIWTASTPGGDLYALGDLYQYADLYAVGAAAWNPIQKFAPGTYQTRYLYFDFQLETADPQTIAELLEAKILITLPGRIDQYALTTSASADTAVAWGQAGVVSTAPLTGTASPFNGGAGPSNLPAINWGITDAQAGDDLIITALSLSAISFKILNGGARVVRSLTLTAEGY